MTKQLHQAGKSQRVIPGFGLSMGITLFMLSGIILIPLASVLVYSFQLSPREFLELITKTNVINAFRTSLLCSLFAASVNSIFGLILQ